MEPLVSPNPISAANSPSLPESNHVVDPTPDPLPASCLAQPEENTESTSTHNAMENGSVSNGHLPAQEQGHSGETIISNDDGSVVESRNSDPVQQPAANDESNQQTGSSNSNDKPLEATPQSCASNEERGQENGSVPVPADIEESNSNVTEETVADPGLTQATSTSSTLPPIGEVDNETDESSAIERSSSGGYAPESSSSVATSPAPSSSLASSPGDKKRRIKARSTTFFDPPSSAFGKKKTTSLIRKSKSAKQRKALTTESSMDGGTGVSLAAPELTTDWDPTCLLEELYQDHRAVAVPSSATGENSRHAGYLDKLPVNQRKPTVMKGWKTRFFRLTRGSLFYYDDESAAKATSFIRLTDSKIIADLDSLKIEIVEKGSGNFIILRADNKQETNSWHRALQLEAVHPTMTHRMSLSPPNATPTLIIDLGSCSVRAGIATDSAYPQVFFPTVCAEDEEMGTVEACGLEAMIPSVRSHCQLVYPRRSKARMDSNDSIRVYLHAIIEKVVHLLHVDPANCNAVVAISSTMPESQKQDLAELLLEMFGFHGILLQEQAVLALYSYNCTSGIVVNAGDSIEVVPIIDGYKLDTGSSYIPYCGNAITESLSKLAALKDIRYFSGIEMYIIRFIKESICFMSSDYFQDTQQCEEAPSTYIRAVDVDRFNLPDHRKVIHLDSALFKAPEGLFNPGSFGKDVAGLHELIVKAIENCPMDMRKEMARRIYLAGGTTLMVGFPERLEIELRQLLMPRSDVQVHGSEHRQHAAYLGASVLASLASFEKSLITLEDWTERGLDALNKSAI